MNKAPTDYWSFVEKIQDATDYVQELLAENQNLQRRMADLENEKKDLARKLGTLRQLIQRERCEDPLLSYQIGPGEVAGMIQACPPPAPATPVLQAV